MKKILIMVLTLVMCSVLVSCSAKEVQENTSDVTAPSTTEFAIAPLEEKTTKIPSSDKAKGDSLKTVIIKALGENELSGQLDIGSFTYRYSRDAKTVYKFEYMEQTEKKAMENVDSFISVLSSVYPYELTQYDYNVKQIGSGDNGIDSVRYEFYYINTQNQLLSIYADSDGTISYVDCRFTW